MLGMSPNWGKGMRPPLFFDSVKETLQRGFSCRCAAIHLQSPPQRWKRNRFCVQILPIRAGLDKYGGRANPCGINLPGFIRVRCVSALNGTFKPQIDASGGNLWAVNERVFAAAPCVPLRYTLRCRRSAAAPLLGAHSLPCSRSARTVSGRPHRLMKPVALVWS